MGSVTADDEVDRQFRSVGQGGFDGVVTLTEVCDAGVEAILGLVLGLLMQHVDQVAAQNLELGHQPVAVECGNRHFRSPVSVGLDPGDAALIERARPHLVDQAHALDHFTTGTAEINGLSAGADTIAELADGIRPGGQTVDLRGAGGEVVERMGLIDKMRARSLDQRGVAWIKSDGHRRAEMPVTAFNGNGLVSKLEILRGDLVDVLHQETKDQTEYRFNAGITDLSQSDDAVEATLTDGTKLSVDLVVGCDGPHSAVR